MSLLSQLGAEWKALRSLVEPGPLFARSHPFAHQFEVPSQRFDFESHVGDPLHNGVVAACVNAIARALPDAPLLLEQRTDAGWQSVDDHPALQVLRAPNPDHSDADVWGLTSGYKATRGQAFWLLLPNARGEVGEIHVWNPDRVTVLGDESHFIAGYRVRRENGSHFDADRSQIIHFRHLPDFHNPRVGWSPLGTGRSQIAGDNVAASYHSSILFNAGVVSLLISLKDGAAGGQVTPQQFQQVLDNIRRASRERSGGVEGINLPLEVHKLAYSPDEMSLDKLIEYYETRICSVMGVSQRVAGLGTDPTYNNLSEALNDFWERRIVPDRNADAATLNRQWLPLFGLDDGGWRFRFDYSGVPALQENRDALHNRVRADFEKGLLDRRQARALLGYSTENDGRYSNVFYGDKPVTETGAKFGEAEAQSGFETSFKANPNWDESQHPRDERGQFASSSGGALEGDSHVYENEEDIYVNEAQAVRELEIVNSALKGLLPGMKSRWGGKLVVRSRSVLKAVGTKSFSCVIQIAQIQFHKSRRARLLCTMIHEMLHGFSPTTESEYQLAKPWQEAVIDGMTRLVREDVAKRFYGTLTPEQFAARDAAHPYTPCVKALEMIRTSLGDAGSDKMAFYRELLGTPAHKIEARIEQMSENLPPRQKRIFAEMLKGQKPVFDDPKK